MGVEGSGDEFLLLLWRGNAVEALRPGKGRR